MTAHQERSGHFCPYERPLGVLLCLGAVSGLIYVGIALMSEQFAAKDPLAYKDPRDIDALQKLRPIVEVVCLFWAAFVCYLTALVVAIRAGNRRGLLPTIAGFALMFRLALLFSYPIQEVDIYRYLWDGEAVVAGVNPFQYSPQQVREADADDRLSKDLSRLVAARDSSLTAKEILASVHFRELPTVYPPVSQAIFAAAKLTSPQRASLYTRVVVMKAWIFAFDMASFLLLVALLRYVGKPVGWSLAYGWCPLVLKEFANSGHLDAIAVCLTMLAVYLAVRAFYPGNRPEIEGKTFFHSQDGWALGAAAVLGLAVGAKLFPLVLALLMFAVAIRRNGWIRALLCAVVFSCVTATVCWPILPDFGSSSLGESGGSSGSSDDLAPALEPESAASSAPGFLPPTPDSFDSTPQPSSLDPQDPSRGLTTFLSEWEMNDFVFLILVENLRPSEALPADKRPWFVITPAHWRTALTEQAVSRWNIHTDDVPFALARLATGVGFFLLAAWFAWCGSQSDDPLRFLEAAFLTLAWFWLLLPTQNPWYWTWALPLIPFARGRAWLFVSGLVLVYYFRFWLDYQWGAAAVGSTKYAGAYFFDYIVTWLEFGPWFLCLAAGAVLRKARKGGRVSGLTNR